MTEAPIKSPAALLASTTVRIETTKIEGSLLTIRDLIGMQGAQTAAQTALQRVCRASNDNDGWIS